MSNTDQDRAVSSGSWTGVATSIVTNLIPLPFLYFAYALPPDGPWDHDAIDVDRMASWAAIWASLIIAVPQVVLVMVRQLRWPWLLVPLLLLVLAAGRYAWVRAAFGH
ncbi:hypothetical protein HUO13_01835 [Saccharopolyspora erythraea]|uniref:hypothetical protein n=1 Tax=Saccharopolyspora erythraea TaxID=1836 RepID=UPI001BAA38DC|nr:hypothetical protein [Saccharopolyspora erythraea]QUG99705.1 hypothetical protein HUO13_01835 [Saccharopolyspora erythraea]